MNESSSEVQSSIVRLEPKTWFTASRSWYILTEAPIDDDSSSHRGTESTKLQNATDVKLETNKKKDESTVSTNLQNATDVNMETIQNKNKSFVRYPWLEEAGEPLRLDLKAVFGEERGALVTSAHYHQDFIYLVVVDTPQRKGEIKSLPSNSLKCQFNLAIPSQGANLSDIRDDTEKPTTDLQV